MKTGRANAPVAEISLYFSLLAGNWGGDRFVPDCVVSQPVRSLSAVSVATKNLRHSRRLRRDHLVSAANIRTFFAHYPSILCPSLWSLFFDIQNRL